VDESWVFAFWAVTGLCLAGLSPLLFAATYHLLLETLYISRVRKRARHDYRAARGTQHLRQLRASLTVLQKSMRAREARMRDKERQLDLLKRKRSVELRSALSRHLVENRLTEIHGIGPRLSRRIVGSCFRGNLRDLRSAHRVKGIGPTHHRAIMAWVSVMEAQLPRLLEGNFPGKQRVMGKYAGEERSLQEAVEREQEALNEEKSLHETANGAIQRLQKIKPAHFRQALQRRSLKSPVPAWYLLGVFPAWEPMPEWFETLLGEYGG
jgi:hypothetical protein